MTLSRGWPAPAKLNLMLHITGQREDGYHQLQTVFQFVDHGDTLDFEVNDDGHIERPLGATGIDAEHDLVVQAAEVLKHYAGSTQGASIHVHKQLPLGAGLGGGSSNAATTLHALNQLWQLDYSTNQLAAIGLELGADVPVFVHGFAAFAEGVGEQLTPLELEQPFYLVLTPPESISTAEMFHVSELTRDCAAIKICDLPRTGWKNVFTPVVTKRYLSVAKALKMLSEYGEAHMSGTGASVFVSFDSEPKARAAQAELKDSGLTQTWTHFVARGCNESPLMRFMHS